MILIKKNPYLTASNSGVSQSLVVCSTVYKLNYLVFENNQLDIQFFLYVYFYSVHVTGRQHSG